MNTDTFTFEYRHEVELPCGNTTKFTYYVEAQPEAQYIRNDFTGRDEFDGLSFHIIGVDLPGFRDVNIYGPGQDMAKFRAKLEEAARDHYERRNGVTDFETVTIYDMVNEFELTVHDALQTV